MEMGLINKFSECHLAGVTANLCVYMLNDGVHSAQTG
jgi:hypothetical protein